MSQDKSTTTTPDTKARDANAYDVQLSPGRRRVVNLLAVIGLVASVIAGLATDGPTLWGLLPIVLYAVLCLLGMDIVVGTVLAVLSGVLIVGLSPLETGTLLGESLADSVTAIGLIIVLGAGVGEVLRVTGVASTIVHGVMRVVGDRNRTAVVLGVMIACLILVASLGTLAGALAIAAPIVLPITARLGYTRSATASMLFIGGCAGLTVAPFAGSNVAIMTAADVGYLTYLGYGAGPLAILSLILGPFVVAFIQRRTAGTGDEYELGELVGDDGAGAARAPRAATIAFVVTLLASVVYATITEAGTNFPLLALPLLGVVTGVAGRLPARDIAEHMYRGGAKLISILLLFWLLAALFALIDKLAPFQVILDAIGPELATVSGFGVAIAIAVLGWVGVPGATAAQVVLLDKVFGTLAASAGVGPAAWVVVLLFASKADTYGPFPNANMVGSMGLARSSNLKNMMITGWLMLIPACVMYAGILLVTT
ncbi:Na+/H+ antiporter family protein [Kribbella amoyensis]|uniref:Na+/H+ antiporter family protein n=1 Tax=Kribbella amoyensis TaxID=996641 RepID=A0A561B0Y0_9ACTN|nr:Na+/H+ antiporter NhaC family protein [Kribbella amoyensis]TWD72518.1 Na+/H+ antiporter family protein [Kribbella amoyensis]